MVEQATDIEELKSTASDLQADLEKSKKENEKLIRLKTNAELKELVTEREVKLRVHEKELNDLEQYTRRNSVRVYGIQDTNRLETSEHTAKLVANLINTKLDMSVKISQIDLAHRLGSFRHDGNRPIICKFLSRETKVKTLRARRKLKGSAVVIREDLTKKNAKLLETVSAMPEVKSARAKFLPHYTQVESKELTRT